MKSAKNLILYYVFKKFLPQKSCKYLFKIFTITIYSSLKCLLAYGRSVSN